MLLRCHDPGGKSQAINHVASATAMEHRYEAHCSLESSCLNERASALYRIYSSSVAGVAECGLRQGLLDCDQFVPAE